MPFGIKSAIFSCFGQKTPPTETTPTQQPTQANPAGLRVAAIPQPVRLNQLDAVPTNPLALPDPPPRPVDTGFQPGRRYTPTELQCFATNRQFSESNRMALLQAMANAMNEADCPKAVKASLCQVLSDQLRDHDSIQFLNAPRQANYFASYGIDMALQCLSDQYSVVLERNLRQMLDRWVKQLCPAQTEFNLDGVVYSRQEITALLNNRTLISRQIPLRPDDLATRLENRLNGVGTSLPGQTVHDAAVRDNGERLLNLMKAAHRQSNEMTPTNMRQAIQQLADKHPRQQDILRGMEKTLTNPHADSNWRVPVIARQVLGHVIQYISAKTDIPLKNNLNQALLERLIEIDREDPCAPGIMQRLLDVPSGIDPAMDIAAKSRQVGEDLATLAGKTRQRVDALIEEGLEALPNQDRTLANQQGPMAIIGENMFEARVNLEMQRLRGLPAGDLTEHVNKLKLGFR
ncbi:hypothetical protein NQT62_00835 [Limnobacter humi]|uniref:Uncharacterized protein n=1 Tax=Limnobacter humi TaxID=1778671 RepID=A0ABT1WE15_9BURK|nr:hypothetical protein [Limnobacter humi]MCQ8894982.1 hypothetical protein [Limnobacter humi]